MTEQIIIRLYNKEPVRFAKGGLARAAETVRAGGQGDDDILLHVSPEEFEVIQSQWGPPEINPVTGLPEYGWLSKKWKSLKKYVKKIGKRGLSAPFKNPLKTLKESLQDPVVRTVGPWVLNAFLPGAGTAVGSALGASGALAPVVGQAVIQGGLGAASAYAADEDIGQGALRGAISGAVSGGLGSMAGTKLGLEGATADIVGSGLAGGIGAGVTGEDPLAGALTSGLGAVARQYLPQRGVGEDPLEGIDPGLEGAITPEGLPPEIHPTVTTAGVPPTPAGTVAPGAAPKRDLLGMAIKYGLPLLSAARGQDYEEGVAPELPEGFYGDLPELTPLNRSFQGLPSAEDYFTYGQAGAPQSGQNLFITPSTPFGTDVLDEAPAPGGTPGGGAPQGTLTPELEAEGWTIDPITGELRPPEAATAAHGGYQRGGLYDYWEQNDDVFSTTPTVSRRGGHHVRGPGSGRSDDIPAKLSDGEYVIDAESVALLGDGSGDAGAQRLDEMRSNLRKHKAKNLGKGEFSHKAKRPDKYMGRLRRTAKYEHGGVHNVAVGGTI